MVNDFHVSEAFYGESALHIAIINEDLQMVKLLVSYGADLHQRCSGRFFCPDDQKSGLKYVLTDEHPIFPAETNYEGFLYYGEYPLTFAVVLNQFDIVEFLMQKGARINKQDSNGNTASHMLAINNNLV